MVQLQLQVVPIVRPSPAQIKIFKKFNLTAVSRRSEQTTVELNYLILNSLDCFRAIYKHKLIHNVNQSQRLVPIDCKSSLYLFPHTYVLVCASIPQMSVFTSHWGCYAANNDRTPDMRTLSLNHDRTQNTPQAAGAGAGARSGPWSTCHCHSLPSPDSRVPRIHG